MDPALLALRDDIDGLARAIGTAWHEQRTLLGELNKAVETLAAVRSSPSAGGGLSRQELDEGLLGVLSRLQEVRATLEQQRGAGGLEASDRQLLSQAAQAPEATRTVLEGELLKQSEQLQRIVEAHELRMMQSLAGFDARLRDLADRVDRLQATPGPEAQSQPRLEAAIVRIGRGLEAVAATVHAIAARLDAGESVTPPVPPPQPPAPEPAAPAIPFPAAVPQSPPAAVAPRVPAPPPLVAAPPPLPLSPSEAPTDRIPAPPAPPAPAPPIPPRPAPAVPVASQPSPPPAPTPSGDDDAGDDTAAAEALLRQYAGNW